MNINNNYIRKYEKVSRKSYDAFERVRSYLLFIGSMLDMCKAEQLVSKQFEAPYVINLFTDIP